jgi:hypothetical protein
MTIELTNTLMSISLPTLGIFDNLSFIYMQPSSLSIDISPVQRQKEINNIYL